VNAPSRLVLGTAQLGMRYGIANTAGQLDPTVVTEIISTVWNCGVRFFDTAQAYGLSEVFLGQAFANLSIAREACVITKLKGHHQELATKSIIRSLETSLEKLKTPQLWGVMLHDEGELDFWTDSLGEALGNAKRAKLVSQIGVSVYSPDRALQALEIDDLDLIQVPANPFDRRMERAGVFERAQKLEKSVFIRSVYLQGLALMPCDSVPPGIPHAREAVAVFEQFCAQYRMDRRQFAIDYARRMAPNARLVVGAETPTQATENCEFFQKMPVDKSISDAWTKRWPQDIDGLIDVRCWPAAGNS
jgi:aryl-alcohol dehydrogenase-like predicted oxidoreductase